MHQIFSSGQNPDTYIQLFPGQYGSVIGYLHFSRGRKTLSGLNTVDYKAHGVIQNCRAHSAVQRSAYIPHPAVSFALKAVHSLFFITIQQRKIQLALTESGAYLESASTQLRSV